MHGYTGKFLAVDLSDRKISTQELDPARAGKFLGGAGIAADILFKETGPQTDPLGPDNTLIAFTGPFTGTAVPSSSRHHLMARSPLTGILGETNVGGSWAVHFKRAGFDGVVVSGRADKPVYLWVHDGQAELRDATPIWGQDSYDSAAWLKNETTEKATCAVIGQAGEKQALIASIPHIGSIVRAAARTGLGAVMGSKNLKAMVAHGSGSWDLADAEGLQKDAKALLPHVREATATFGQFGTSGGVDNYEKMGNFPLENWRGGRWAGAAKISGATMHDTILSGRKACLHCPIACGRHIKIEDSPYGPMDCEGPEYETIGTMGGECLVDDLAAVCKANELCNRYGLDTISAGATIAFAMEAFEKGLITTADTDGVELTWGSGPALVEMVHKMGRGQGIGELMSQGSLKMAQALGRGAEDFAVQVKGLEPSAHDPRRFFSQAVSYATAARGACHNASWSHPYEIGLSMPEIGIPEAQDPFQVEGKAKFTATLQDLMATMDCLIACRFCQIGGAVSVNNMVKWLNLITGRDFDVASFMQNGERVFNLKRLYNIRLGVGRTEDQLPKRFVTLNRQGEDLVNQLPPMDEMLADYYQVRGWEPDGVPSAATVEALGLSDYVQADD